MELGRRLAAGERHGGVSGTAFRRDDIVPFVAYLHRFPFEVLTTDRAFVGRMTTDAKSFELVRTVLALGNALAMRVVAEGIETEEQLAQLRELGAAYGQGFLFSRPVAPPELGS